MAQERVEITDRVLLASASPRRRSLLEGAGAKVVVAAPAIDDGGARIAPGSPRRVVAALAWFKAAQVLADPAQADAKAASRWLIAADTVCVDGDRIIGKPSDRDDARCVIESLMARAHSVLTGVCVVDLRRGSRRILVDDATVTLGSVPPALLDAHLASDGWRGRAGGYNFAEVRDAGWPITCEGDETTVMGLPLARVAAMLREGHGA